MTSHAFFWRGGGVAAAIILLGGVAVIPSASAAPAAASAAPASAPGTTLYVDTAKVCNNSGPGTQADPFCTIQAAANIVDPGQTVDIADVILWPSQSLTITRSGTPTEPIVFQWTGSGASPELGTGVQPGNASVTLQEAHDVTISGLSIVSGESKTAST